MVLLQQAAEFGDGEPVPARRGEGGHPGDPADVGKGTVGEVTEQQDLPLFGGQLTYEFGNCLGVDSIGGVLRQRLKVRDLIQRIGISPVPFATKIDGDTAGHGQQPPLGVSNRNQTRPVLCNPDENILDHVLGVLG